MFAAERGRTDIVQALIGAGANICAKDRVSCLTIAIYTWRMSCLLLLPF